MDNIKTKYWIFLLGGILLLSVLALFLPSRLTPTATYAEIYQDGVLIETVSLSETKSIPLTNGTHKNTILVEKGTIRMESANCPDKLCVRQGATQSSSSPIVCLPHRLVIKPKGGNTSVDAVSQ